MPKGDVTELLDMFREVQELIQGYVDIGEWNVLDATPPPNNAMRASQIIDEACGRAWDGIATPPRVADSRAMVEMASAADRAYVALGKAIAEPSVAAHRCDISHALNYIETVVRQEETK
jgi:hypothetical protein